MKSKQQQHNWLYKDDLDQTLGVEFVQFAAFFTHFPEDEDDKIGREHLLYKLLMN